MRVCNKIPVIICGNKSEPMNDRTAFLQVTYGRMKSKLNLEKPFLYLADDLNLRLVRPPEPSNLFEFSKETPPKEELERQVL